MIVVPISHRLPHAYYFESEEKDFTIIGFPECSGRKTKMMKVM